MELLLLQSNIRVLSRKPRINMFILGLGTQSFSSGPASLGICSTPGMASADSAKGATANAIDRVSEVGDARNHLTRWLIVHCHDKNQLTQVGRIHSEFIPICCPVPVYQEYGVDGGQYRLKIPRCESGTNPVRIRCGTVKEIFQRVAAEFTNHPRSPRESTRRSGI